MPYFVYFSVADEKGDISTIEIPIPTTVDLADLPDLVQAFATLIEPIVGGGLVQAGVRLLTTVSGWTTLAAAGSDVQEKGEFVFRTINGFLKRLNLPTFIESFFNSGSKEIDQAAPAIAAFITAMEDGVTVNTHLIQPCDTRDEDLTQLTSALENWGKRRR